MSENKYDSGDMDKTLMNCDWALKINAQKDDAWYAKGICWYDLGIYAEA